MPEQVSIMRRLACIILVICLASSFITIFSSQLVKADSNTWVVDAGGTGDFLTITQAVEAAAANDTIFVKDGSYNETLTLSKSLTFIAQSEKTILQGNSDSTAFAVIQGFEILQLEIGGFTLRNYTQGIYVYQEDYQALAPVNIKVENNTISNCSTAILIEGQASLTAKNNTIINCGTGICIQHNLDNTANILLNSIYGSEYGIYIKKYYTMITQTAGSANINIFNNTIFQDTYGIYALAYSGGSVSVNVVNNTIFQNTIGIYAENGGTNTLRDASLSIGIYHNNFTSNTNQVIFPPTGHPYSVISLDDGYPSGGNYWSDCPGIDRYSGPFQNESGRDGVCDFPIHGDNYPLIDALTPYPLALFNYVILDNSSYYHSVLVSFDASQSATNFGQITNYEWNFEDGKIISTINPVSNHIFQSAKDYTITLTVTNDAQLEDSTTYTLTIAFPQYPTTITIYASSPTARLGSEVNIGGILRDVYGNALSGKTIMLYYKFNGVISWIPITSSVTSTDGDYSIAWLPLATGDFSIKAEWVGNNDYFGTANTTSISSYSYNSEYMFLIDSNSTVQGLTFDAKNYLLTFTVNGPEGSSGYARVIIPKSLVFNVNDIKVTLDKSSYSYSILDSGSSWIITFSYNHSFHNVKVDLSTNASFIWLLYYWPFIVIGLVVPISLISINVGARRKARKQITAQRKA